MDWTTFLGAFVNRSREPLEKALGEITHGLEALGSELRILTTTGAGTADRRGDLEGLEGRVRRFPSERLQFVIDAMPRALRGRAQLLQTRVGRLLRELRGALSQDGDAVLRSLQLLNGELDDALRETSDLSAQIGRIGARRAIAVSGVMLLPVVLIGAASAYLRLWSGFAVEVLEVVGPESALFERGSNGGSIVPSGWATKGFMEEFSRKYFGQPGPRWERFAPLERGRVQLECVLSHEERFRTRWIGSVSIVMKRITARRFPWDSLRCDTGFAVRTRGPLVVLRSTGSGPLVDVRFSVQRPDGSGARICESESGVLCSGRELTCSLGPEFEFAEASAGRLNQPLFLLLSSRRPGLQAHTFVEGAATYEEIRSVARLAEVTAIATMVRASTAFRSLKGERVQREDDVPLENGVAYRVLRELSARDPRPSVEAYPVPIPAPSEATMAEAFRAMPKVVERILGGPLELPKGVDKVAVSLGASGRGLRIGERHTEIVKVDEFLNPRGIVSVRAGLEDLRTGSYLIEVRIDGQTHAQTVVEVLVPERRAFDCSDPRSFPAFRGSWEHATGPYRPGLAITDADDEP